MNNVENIHALRQQKIDVAAKANAILTAADGRQFTPEEGTALDGHRDELKKLEAAITKREFFLQQEKTATSTIQVGKDNAIEKPWASFGEQLRAVRTFFNSTAQIIDPRLYRAVPEGTPVQAALQAALGQNESVPAEGGFLVQPEFAAGILKRTYDVGMLLGRCMTMPMASNRLVINVVDEDSRVDGSRWGGLNSFWLAEAGTYNPTKAKFRQMELIAKKLIGLCYQTEEQLEDAPALEAYINQTFPLEFAFRIDDAIYNGGGAGLPLGFMLSGALLTIAKDSGQAAKTVSVTNVLNMWSRLFARSRPTACWLVNQDVEPQLYPLALQNSSGAILFQSPLYTPPGQNGNNSSYGVLLGRPVIPVEQAATLGTTGDIVLADMQQYMLATKGDVRADTSIHVAFLTGEMAFRFQIRLDGQPMWKKPLTPKNGSNTLSPFIALATRA